MNLQIGKIYRMKDGGLARLQGVSRSIVHHRKGEVRHFVEVSFHRIGEDEFHTFSCVTPLNEILPDKSSEDKQRIMGVVEAIANGTPIPLTAPHALLPSP